MKFTAYNNENTKEVVVKKSNVNNPIVEKSTLEDYYKKNAEKEAKKVAAKFVNNLSNAKNTKKSKPSFFDISNKRKTDIPKNKFKVPSQNKFFKKIKYLHKVLYNSTKGIRLFFIRIFKAIKRKGDHERSILVFYRDEESGVRLPINNFTLLFILLVLGTLIFTGVDAYSKQQNAKAFYNTLSSREAKTYSLIEDYRNTLGRFTVALNNYNNTLKNISLSINYDNKNDDLVLRDSSLELTDVYKILQETESYQKNIMSFMDIAPKIHNSIPVGWPVSGGGRITSGFGARLSPFTKQKSYHYGVDIAGAYGSPILVVADGTVTFAGWKNGYGWFVIVKHANGYETAYGHNSKLLVTAGQKIKRGDKVALIGNTGRTTGIHCHFEVRIDGEYKNPMPYLSARF